MSRRLAAGALLMAALCAAGKGDSTVQSDPAHIKLALPQDWSVQPSDERNAAMKVFSLSAVGAEPGGKPRPSVSADFYAPGNTVFASTAAYIKGNTYEPLGGPGPKVAAKKLGGRKAWTFSRRQETAKGAAVLEEQWVVPAPGGGFHVLILAAAEDDFARNKPIFEKVIKSIKFLP